MLLESAFCAFAEFPPIQIQTGCQTQSGCTALLLPKHLRNADRGLCHAVPNRIQRSV